MAGVTYLGIMRPHDSTFGVSHNNIVPKLNRRNWKNKATCRVHAEGPLYITVKRGERSSEGKLMEILYRVSALIVDEEEIYDKNFPTLIEALSFANGEDGGEISRETRSPEGVHEYPAEVGGEVVISGISRTEQGLVPNFSVQFREPPPEEE